MKKMFTMMFVGMFVLTMLAVSADATPTRTDTTCSVKAFDGQVPSDLVSSNCQAKKSGCQKDAKKSSSCKAKKSCSKEKKQICAKKQSCQKDAKKASGCEKKKSCSKAKKQSCDKRQSCQKSAKKECQK